MGSNCQSTRGLAFLLLLVVSASLADDAARRPTFGAYAATPPHHGAVGPRAGHPLNRYYRPRPDAGFYRARYPDVRDDLPEDYYQTHRPLPAFAQRRNYYNYAYRPTPLYTGRPLRAERRPPVYNPYYVPRAYADGGRYDTFARPWRYHGPYSSTRYFEPVRPAWPRYRPSYTYFPSTMPSFSGFVRLPSRIYYPHFLHGSDAASHVLGAINPLRLPVAAQFLVFIPDLEEMNQPDLLPLSEDEVPVYQAGKPQQSVDAVETDVSPDVGVFASPAVGVVASPDEHPVPDDTDLNQSHGGDDVDRDRQTTTEKSPAETTLIYPTSATGEVVGQSQDVNEAGAEPTTVADETTSEQMVVSAAVVHSVDKPTQSASLAAETAVTTGSPGAGLSGENGDEIATESEAAAAAEEEYAHVYATELPDTENSPDAVIKPLNQNEEALAELEQTQENEASGLDVVTESLPTDTTLAEEDEENDDYQETTVTQLPASTEKAVYVQLHLLPQDNSSSSTASPVVKVTPPDADKENTSESNLFFLGEMPNDQPETQRDRIYKRYSETKSQAKLSLDFKTVAVMPTFV